MSRNHKFFIASSVLTAAVMVLIWRASANNLGKVGLTAPSHLPNDVSFYPQSPTGPGMFRTPAQPLQLFSKQREPGNYDAGYPQGDESGFGRQLYDLALEQERKPSIDPADDLIEQFDLLIDDLLGGDFPQERRAAIHSSARILYGEKFEAERAFAAGLLTREEVQAAVAQSLDADAKRLELILSADEYERLFGFPKGIRPSQVLGLSN